MPHLGLELQRHMQLILNHLLRCHDYLKKERRRLIIRKFYLELDLMLDLHQWVTGISSKDIRFVIGITGLSPKSSKVLMDGRFTGHERHQGSDYRLPLAPKFDRSDRYVSRCNEIIEPCRIIHGTFHPRLMGPEEVKATTSEQAPF